MSSDDPDNKTIDRLEGPYEFWTFSEPGRQYALGDVPARDATQIAALAEVAPGHDLVRRSELPGIGMGPPGAGEAEPGIGDILKRLVDTGAIARKPTLWSGAFAGQPEGQARFIPIVLEVQHFNKGTQLTFDDLRASLFSVSHIKLPGLDTLVTPSSTPLAQGTRIGAELAGGNVELTARLEQGSTFGPSPAVEAPLFQGFRVNAPMRPSTVDVAFSTDLPELDYHADAALKAELESRPTAARGLVVVAVIDDGLAFAHRDLRDKRGAPRMEFCWLQAADRAEGAADRTVLFGREHTRLTIAELIARQGTDEDALYRAAGAIRGGGRRSGPLASLTSHGAHVLDLAAGHRESHPAADRPVVDADGNLDRMRVIGVELPSPVTLDTVGFGKDAFVLSAFHYIFDRADRIGAAYGQQNIPLVINFSFGFTGGPHDGSDRLEQAISELIKAREALGSPTRLVMPAGNNFSSALLSEITSDHLEPDGTFTCRWRVQPDDHSSNYLEIWFPKPPEAATDHEPEKPVIRDPAGNPIELGEPVQSTNSPAQKIWQIKVGGSVVGQVSIDRFRSRRWRILIITAPTAPTGDFDRDHRPAPAGLWRITVKADRIAGTKRVVSCRIQRDDDPSGHPRGARQSYFDDLRDEPFGPDGAIAKVDKASASTRRFGTLNGLATHDRVTVVGGFVENSLVRTPDGSVVTLPRPSDYSSAGRKDASIDNSGRVHCSAPSDTSSALPGQRAAGTRSGSSARLLGTSAAAPQISRAIALAWLNDPTGRSAPAPGGGASAVVIEELQPIDRPAAPGDGASTGKVEENPEQALRRARLGDSILVRTAGPMGAPAPGT